MDNVEKWMKTVTGDGDVALEEVLPWNDLFDGKMRVVIPAENENDRNLKRLALILWNNNWQVPKSGASPSGTVPYRNFPIERAVQKKRRPGGEVYEVEVDVARLNVEKTTTKTIPKGPRKGEEIQKTETTSIAKALNKMSDRKKGYPGVPLVPEDLLEWWKKNQTFYTQSGNWKQLAQQIKDPENDANLDERSIIISRDPRDVIRMGDMELEKEMGKIGHCHQEGGAYAPCAIAEAKGTSPIAYLVSTKEIDNFLTDAPYGHDADVADTITKKDISDYDGQEIFSDAQRNIKGIKVINRLRLRQFLDERTGDQWAIPSIKIYPPAMKVPGWDQAVQKWAWDNQKEMLEDNYEEGEFPDLGDWVRFGGWYTDPGDLDGAVLNKFFTQSGTDPDYEKDKNVTNTTEEDQGPSVIEQWEAQMEETLEAYNGRYEHSSLWGEIDEGDDPEHPMMWYTGQFEVQFDEDLFGDDAGADYEVTSLDDWQTLQGFEKDLKSEMDARGMYKYFDELTFESGYGHRANVSFRFDISRDDYDGNPAGLDSFAADVENNWDTDHDEIYAALRRVLINEGYMAPLPVDRLAKAEPYDFKFWDIDVDDGGSVSVRLDTPELAAGGAPYRYRPGIFVGELPPGMQLEKAFTDWNHAGHSWEFTNAFVPKIRALFAEAEKYVQQQLDLPGMEQEDDVLGLLIPSRAQWRLDQSFGGPAQTIGAPARIFLQVALDVGEDVDEAGMEEIEHFLKYLDRQEAMEFLQAAARETLEEAIGPAETRVQKEKKIASFREELNTKFMTMPLKELLSLATNMKGPSNMLADANDALSWMSTAAAASEPLSQYGYPTIPEDFNAATTTAALVQQWIKGLDEMLDKMNRGEITAFDPQYAFDPAERRGGIYWVRASVHREAQAEAGPTGRLKIRRAAHERDMPYFFLPQHARGELRSLWGGLKDLIPNMINKMQDMANTYSGDSYDRVSYYTTPNNREMADATWLPEWWVPLMYKYEFFDPEMSFDDEVIAALQQKQKETAEKADPQKKFELKESLSLLDKIDAKLNERKGGPDVFRAAERVGTDFIDPESDIADRSYDMEYETGDYEPDEVWLQPHEDFEVQPDGDYEDYGDEPELEVYPDQFMGERERWIQAYSEGGINRQIWIDKIKRETGLSDFDAANKYDNHPDYKQKALDTIMQTPMYSRTSDTPGPDITHFSPEWGETGRRRIGDIFLDPEETPGVASHELAHALGWRLGTEGKEADKLAVADLKKVFPELDPPVPEEDPRAGADPTRQNPRGHSYGSAEIYANVIQTRRDLGRKFTPKDIKAIRGGVGNMHPKLWNTELGDLEQALQRQINQNISDEDIADILNRVAVRQPKAVRGEPTQTIAESKKRKIRIRVKKK